MPELTPPNLDYMAFPHQVLSDNVADVEPGAVGEAAAVWDELATALREFGDDLHAAMSRESAGWRGPASESVFEFGRQLATFAEETGEQDQSTQDAGMNSADAGARAKSSMPAPVNFDRQAEFQDSGLRLMTGDVSGGLAQMEALDAKQAAAEDAHRKAADVSTNHAQTLYDAHSRGFEFSSPPTLSGAAANVGDDGGARVGGVNVDTPTVAAGATQAAGTGYAPPAGSPVPSAHQVGLGGQPPMSSGPTSGVAQPTGPGGGTPGAPPSSGLRPGPGAGAFVPPVTDARRGGDAPRSNRSPFGGLGGRGGTSGTPPRPGQNLAGPRMTGGPGANAPGKGAGVAAPRPEIGGRAAANAAAASGRGGPGGMGPGGAARGKSDEEDKEHKDKYFVPESPVGEDPVLDEATGAAIDPETGMTVPRPVIGEGPPAPIEPQAAPAQAKPEESSGPDKPAAPPNPYV